MPDDILTKVSIETGYDAYTSLWDSEYTKQLFEVAGDSAILRQLVLDLSMTWKAANYTHAAPPLLIQGIHDFYKNLMNVDDLECVTVKAFNIVVSEMQAHLSLAHLRNLRMRVERGASAAKRQAIKQLNDLSMCKAWPKYLAGDPFRLMIWGTQRLAYVAVWDGYEAFVKALIKTIEPKASRDRELFKKVFVDKFKHELFQDCWSTEDSPEGKGHPVNVGRVVRNTLCHAGGRVGKFFSDLPEEQRKNIDVVEGKIQIWPTNTRTLYNALKDRVLALAKEAATMACFHTT
jgi:hypothetical protein